MKQNIGQSEQQIAESLNLNGDNRLLPCSDGDYIDMLESATCSCECRHCDARNWFEGSFVNWSHTRGLMVNTRPGTLICWSCGSEFINPRYFPSLPMAESGEELGADE